MTRLLAIAARALSAAVATVPAHAATKEAPVVAQIRAEFSRELPVVVADLHAQAAQRINEFRQEVDAAIPKIARKIAEAIADDKDGYFTRARTGVGNLEADITRIAKEEIEHAFKPMLDAAVEDLIREEVWARARLLIHESDAWKRPLRDGYSVRIDGLRDTKFFRDLSQNAGLAVKGADDAAEFIPIVGLAYGAVKLVYDPRVETRVIQPAEQFFTPILQQSLRESIEALSARYESADKLAKVFEADWSALKALSLIRGNVP